MKDLETLVRKVSELTKVPCRPATPKDLEVLREMGPPQRVFDFYAEYEPLVAMEYGPCIRRIGEIDAMRNQGSCASAAFAAGLFPFGDDMNGDALCFDPRRLDEEGWPAVVCVSHETVDGDSSPEEVLAGTEPFCKNLPELLEMMLNNAPLPPE